MKIKSRLCCNFLYFFDLGSEEGLTEFVKLCVEKGSNINETDGYGETALHYGNSILMYLFNDYFVFGLKHSGLG